MYNFIFKTYKLSQTEINMIIFQRQISKNRQFLFKVYLYKKKNNFKDYKGVLKQVQNKIIFD